LGLTEGDMAPPRVLFLATWCWRG